ncbi:MAG: HdeA/HdeB family chaperone [Xenococcus sp. MO_188.B8]|nr:HdeA/HdeB family chaperone [Xenococcus sp. MO_188.B8]
MICKKLSFSLLLATLTMGIVKAPVQAQYTEEILDISKLTCADFLKLSKDRESTITYLYAYVSGQKGQPIINASSAAATTDKVVDYCIANTQANLLETFKQFHE